MKHIKSLAKQTAVYGFSTIIGKFLNYLLVPLYTNVFETNDYGSASLLFSYAGILMVVLTYGTETTFFRFNQLYKKSPVIYNSLFTLLIITTSIFFIVTFSFSSTISTTLKINNALLFKWFILILVADTICALPYARLRAQNRALKFASIKLINIGLNIGLNIFFIVLCRYLYYDLNYTFIEFFYNPNYTYEYIFLSNLIANLVTLIILLPLIFEYKISFKFRLIKKLLIYSSPLLFVGVSGIVNSLSDRILLKYFSRVPEAIADIDKFIDSQIGIYNANTKIAGLILMLNMAFRYAAEPFFFSLSKNKDSKKSYADVMLYYVIFMLFCFLVIVLFIDILKYFIGKDYRSGLHIVPILTLSYIFQGILFNLSIWYKLSHKTLFGAYISVFGTLIILSFNILFIPDFGYNTCAYVALCGFFVMSLMSFFLGRRYYPINYNFKSILIYFCSALILWLISNIVNFESILIMYVFKIFYLSLFVILVIKYEKIHVKKLISTYVRSKSHK